MVHNIHYSVDLQQTGRERERERGGEEREGRGRREGGEREGGGREREGVREQVAGIQEQLTVVLLHTHCSQFNQLIQISV